MSAGIESIVMPKLGLSMTEGAVAQWRVKAGATVSPGDIVADIETSKITNELEAGAAGVVKKLLAEAGVELPVGALLGVIADESVSDADIERFVAAFKPEDADSMMVTGDASLDEQPAAAEPRASDPEKRGVGVAVPEGLKGDGDDSATPATHLARRLARRLSIDLSKVTGTGRRGRVSKKDIERAVRKAGGDLSLAASREDAGENSRIPSTPIARRRAEQAGIGLASIAPTGSRGRVTRADVDNAIATAGKTGRSGMAAGSAAGGYTEVPLTSTRRVIAERLSSSKRAAPHYRLTVEANIDQMLRLRADMNRDMNGAKVSINDLLVKAVAQALIATPEVNAQFDGNVIRRFADANIAVAVALEEGLIAPVIHAANRKSVVAISKEMADLAARAKAGALSPDELQGGTFTVSNLGMFGVKAFDAIINPPQAAILAVGAGEKRRIYSGEKEIVATVMTITLSCDHRVIDGATGARFTRALKENIERPYRLLLSD